MIMKASTKRFCTRLNGLESMRRLGPVDNSDKITHANSMIRSIANSGEPNEASAVLAKKPIDLYALWDEYAIGSPGKKAARLITPKKRGTCKLEICSGSMMKRY